MESSPNTDTEKVMDLRTKYADLLNNREIQDLVNWMTKNMDEYPDEE